MKILKYFTGVAIFSSLMYFGTIDSPPKPEKIDDEITLMEKGNECYIRFTKTRVHDYKDILRDAKNSVLVINQEILVKPESRFDCNITEKPYKFIRVEAVHENPEDEYASLLEQILKNK
jgi:hypothetical protein